MLIFLYGKVVDRVFWSDAKLDRLESANLDGSDRVEVLKVKYILFRNDTVAITVGNSLILRVF